MKLFTMINGEKLYLDVEAPTRYALALKFNSYWLSLDGYEFHVEDVYAEPSGGSTLTGAAVGGAIGALGGPVGILLGGLIGSAVGSSGDNSEQRIADKFNRSRV